MDEYSWKISTFLCSFIWFRDCEQIFIQHFKNNSHPLTSRVKSAYPEQSEGPLVVQKKERPSKFKSSVFDHFPVWTGLFCEN